MSRSLGPLQALSGHEPSPVTRMSTPGGLRCLRTAINGARRAKFSPGETSP